MELNACLLYTSGYRLIAGYMGIVMILAGIITLLPLFTLFFYPEEMGQAQYFVAPGVSSILAGYLLSLVLRGRDVYKRQGEARGNNIPGQRIRRP